MIRKFEFKGGPFDGWEGEYVANGQEVIRYGPPGEQVYIYRRHQPLVQVRRSKVDKFRYDRLATKTEMLAAGFSPEQADLAGNGNLTAEQRADGPSYEQAVKVEQIAGRWVMVAEDVILAERPLHDIADANDAKAWVAEVMLPKKEANA